MISANRVREIFMDSLLPTDHTDDTKCISVYAVTSIFGLDPEKIENHRDEIRALMEELPNEFWDEPIGQNGYSFLKLPFTKDGEQWGEQQNAQELMFLGLASGYMQYLFSMDFWKALPGSVPYVTIHKEPISIPSITVKDVKENHAYSISPLIM